MKNFLFQKKPTSVNMFGPMKGVKKHTYDRIFKLLSEFDFVKKAKNKKKLSNTMYALANYTFLVNDKVKHSIVWDVDYDQIKSFSDKNRHLVRYLLKECFKTSLLDFERWMHVDVGLIECQMHRPGTNASNKNTFG